MTVSPREAGVYLIDKPAGMTSFGAVRLVRRALAIKKVGHAGTLDPFATGLLIICAGRPATREISRFMAGGKVYSADIRLGRTTETGDPEGRVVEERPVTIPEEDELRTILAGFTGKIIQRVPRYSALKHKGKPLYYYARRGIEVDKPPRPVSIDVIDLVSRGEETLRIRVCCGKGTYIRILAEDIGEVIGCGAHLSGLRRLEIGPFSVAHAVRGEDLADRERAAEILAGSGMSVSEALSRLKGE